MDSFLDDVDGCVLTIKELHSAISFPTPSDALFASVILKYANVTMDLFDDLFTVFRLTEFRSDNLKMGRTHDILDHIAEQRRSIIRARGAKSNQMAVQSSSQARVPLLVIDLVAEYLDNERIPFHSSFMQLHPACEADDLLREMSLVHRSWTDAAQRCLRRRIYFRGGQLGMGALLQSPRLGPWVRDLSIVSHFFPLENGDRQLGTNYWDTPKILKTILKRCPNVINLHLQDFQPHTTYSASYRSPVNGTPYNFVPALGDLIFLENLWLHQIHDEPATSLPELCAVIPRLRSLRSLSLRNWSERDPVESENDEQLNVSGSKGSLEALSLNGIYETGPSSSLTIALQNHAPSVLELSFLDLRFPAAFSPDAYNTETGLLTMHLRPFVEPVKPYITKLMLSGYQTEDDVTPVLKQFPSLQVLILSVAPFSGLPHVPFLLPASTRSVHIHFCMPLPQPEAWDSSVIAMLEKSPHVLDLLISHNNIPSDNMELLLAGTMRHCEENNVHFELKEMEELPSFCDH